MYMYIYLFLVSWNERECDYWHTNRVGSITSAAHTFYITPTSQRACTLALCLLFHGRRFLCYALFTYKAMNNLAPQYITDLLKPVAETRTL